MTTEPEVEMTIDQIVQVTRSRYFTAAFRVAVLTFSILGTILSTVIGVVVFDTWTKADTAVKVSADVAQKQVDRAKDNEVFQTNIIAKMDDLNSEVDAVHDTQLKISESVGRIEGMLEILRSQENPTAATWRWMASEKPIER